MIKTIHIAGMTCGHCKMKVEKSLAELEAVNSVDVDLLDGTAELDLNKEISDELLASTIKNAGYTLQKEKI
jgi:Cu+-exporting ATPase